jgi:hypothetical protein
MLASVNISWRHSILNATFWGWHCSGRLTRLAGCLTLLKLVLCNRPVTASALCIFLRSTGREVVWQRAMLHEVDTAVVIIVKHLLASVLAVAVIV